MIIKEEFTILILTKIQELLGKIREFYPNGFNIEKIDKRIKAKINELEEKFAKYNNTIADIRKNI